MFILAALVTVIALTEVIVFVIIWMNWHFHPPDVDSDPPGSCQAHLKTLNLVFSMLACPRPKVKTPSICVLLLCEFLYSVQP